MEEREWGDGRGRRRTEKEEWVWGMPLLIGEAVAHLSRARWGMAKGSRSVKLLSCTHDISITQRALIALSTAR